jgi:hypothetical protein
MKGNSGFSMIEERPGSLDPAAGVLHVHAGGLPQPRCIQQLDALLQVSAAGQRHGRRVQHLLT